MDFVREINELAEVNVFTSHFLIGGKEVMRKFTKTETVEIEALHKWFEFKDNDWGMETYRTNRTQYIDFLEIVELAFRLVEAPFVDAAAGHCQENDAFVLNSMFEASL